MTDERQRHGAIVLAARSFMEWWREDHPDVVEPDCPELRRLFALLDHSKRITKRNIAGADAAKTKKPRVDRSTGAGG